jgi:transcriptional regulator with AAA-type ATPase domain/polyferredoxin
MDGDKKVRKVTSQPLGSDAVDFLRSRSSTLTFSDGETIVRRGDGATSFYVILSGEAEVRLTGDKDCQLPLVRLSEGAFFGEISLLANTTASADVVALGAVTVLSCPGDAFSAALSECLPLRTQIMAGMAGNLQRTTTDAWNFFQRAEALNVLVESGAHTGPVIAASRAMKAAVKALDACSANSDPVLVQGGPGTGKTFLASKIHEARGKKNSPFIVVDCRTLSEEEAVPFLFGSSWFRREEPSPSSSRALHNYGALHLANDGSLILRHLDTLVPSAQEVLADYLEGSLAGKIDYPSTRIIGTADEGAEALAARESLNPRLAGLLARQCVVVPSLRKRRKDILPLARLFLEKHRRREDQAFSRQAEHTLVSREYSHRNADELQEAVEMGALFADGVLIEAEHIFTGPKDQGGGLEFNLGQIPLVEKLTSRPALKAARGAVFVLFAVIIFLSLGFGRSRAGTTANAVTWSLWEPLLLVLFLFVGRVWCTVCPLSTAGRLASRVGSLGRAPGDFIKKYTGWLVIAGFIAIIWSEHAFDMTANPFAAGIFLLSLAAAAVFFSLVYRRETWCRYLCPLGSLGAVYAMPAVLSVRANPDVCATYCTTHECFKGTADLPGCPVFHHPLYARDAHHCKMCGSCLWACPHGSARLYLRLPLQGIWRQADLGSDLIPFALFLFFYSPIMLAAQGSSWTSTLVGLTSGTLLAVLCTLAFLPLLPRLFSTDASSDRALPSRVAFSLLILAWGPAMSYQLNHVETLARIRIHAEGGGLITGFMGGGGVSLQLVLQLAVIFLAGALAAISLGGIRMRLTRQGVPLSRRGLVSLRAICTFYTLVSVLLVLTVGRG